LSKRGPFWVSKDEVARFVEENNEVRNFLRKYSSRSGKGQNSTQNLYAQTLCRFFKWLKVAQHWSVSPRELLNDQLCNRESRDVEARRKHITLVLQFTRDNEHPYFKSLSDSRKYHMYIVIKSFYEYHEIPLTSSKGKYGKRKKRKNHPQQISIADAKKILGILPQRERAIVTIILQSGLEIGAVLFKFGYMWPSIKDQLEEGKERIKIEIDERKGGGKWYFTYISRDAIQELKKWLTVREKIVERARKRYGFVGPEIEVGIPIFITNKATPYGENNFEQNYLYTMQKNKMKMLPYEKVSHMFRKLFKTEASIPDRSIDRNIVEFWMGHTNGIEAVGGEYDRVPEVHEDVIEREYEKLEPVINIYSGSVASRRTDPLLADIERVVQVEGGRRFFEQLLKKIDQEKDEWLKKT